MEGLFPWSFLDFIVENLTTIICENCSAHDKLKRVIEEILKKAEIPYTSLQMQNKIFKVGLILLRMIKFKTIDVAV